jgi:hypothetical protein
MIHHHQRTQFKRFRSSIRVNALIGAVGVGLIIGLYVSMQTTVRAAGSLITNGATVYTIPAVTKPAYLVGTIDPTFNTTITRIAHDTGESTSPVTGTWGADTRHVYSKQEPWNADQSLISIENRVGGSPSPLILDGTTYQPILGTCGNYDQYDYRWHPVIDHKNEQINVTSAGTELMWFNVVTCTKTRSWTLPITANYGIGSGEGNVSHDGRFVVIGNDTQLVVVDMDPQAPYSAYPAQRIGPVYTIPPCNFANGASCTIGNVSISPNGDFIDLKYSGPDFDNQDAHRIFSVDPDTLAITPQTMALGALRCGSFANRNDGWIFPLKHADMALDPADNNDEIIIGGRACSGSTIGRIVKVRLRDGLVTALSDPANEASMMHVSARNLNRPGWAYITYDQVPGTRFTDEILAIKTDGSQAVERLSFTRTNKTNCYRCQSHAVPSPDGLRVLFASNWANSCGAGCGVVSDIKDYVIDTRPLRTLPDTTPPSVSLTAPSDGSAITVPQTLTLSAIANDDTGVTRVNFYVDAVLIDGDTTAPYDVPWPISRQQNGTHTLTAVAIDGANNTATSNPGTTITIAIPIDQTPPASVQDLYAH